MFKKILLPLLALFIASCNSPVNYDKMTSNIEGYTLPYLPKEGEAMLYVVRPSPIALPIKWNIFIDGKEPANEIGYTKGEQYIYTTLTPGTHTVYSYTEVFDKIEITAQAGEIIFVHQIPKMGILLYRSELKQIDYTAGAYYVKNNHPGTIYKK